MAEACAAAGAAYVFKASYDKANRTSLSGNAASAWMRGSTSWPR
jgi:3-deoxy-D-manno-octulosonic acid (KDO) 8-phosphate synthase